MSAAVDTVFLFDVDNTLLDNDRIQADLRERLQAVHGDRTARDIGRSFQEQWGAMGYADYFGALARLRLEDPLRSGASRHRKLAPGLSVRGSPLPQGP